MLLSRALVSSVELTVIVDNRALCSSDSTWKRGGRSLFFRREMTGRAAKRSRIEDRDMPLLRSQASGLSVPYYSAKSGQIFPGGTPALFWTSRWLRGRRVLARISHQHPCERCA